MSCFSFVHVFVLIVFTTLSSVSFACFDIGYNYNSFLTWLILASLCSFGWHELLWNDDVCCWFSVDCEVSFVLLFLYCQVEKINFFVCSIFCCEVYCWMYCTELHQQCKCVFFCCICEVRLTYWKYPVTWSFVSVTSEGTASMFLLVLHKCNILCEHTKPEDRRMNAKHNLEKAIGKHVKSDSGQTSSIWIIHMRMLHQRTLTLLKQKHDDYGMLTIVTVLTFLSTTVR